MLAKNILNEEVYLTEVQVAKMLQVSISFLQKQRQKRVGIKYKRFGRAVRYRMQDVQEYLADVEVATDPLGN